MRTIILLLAAALLSLASAEAGMTTPGNRAENRRAKINKKVQEKESKRFTKELDRKVKVHSMKVKRKNISRERRNVLDRMQEFKRREKDEDKKTHRKIRRKDRKADKQNKQKIKKSKKLYGTKETQMYFSTHKSTDGNSSSHINPTGKTSRSTKTSRKLAAR